MEQIVGSIGCFKILVDYNSDLETQKKSRIDLSTKDELMATIQNLDQFFTEKIPGFMIFDYNIVYQALNIIIEKKFASYNLLKLRCIEIRDIISQLIKNYEISSEIVPQIYIQIMALLDFDPEKWAIDLFLKFDILKYFIEMFEIEGWEVRKKVVKAISRMYIDFLKGNGGKLQIPRSINLSKMEDVKELIDFYLRSPFKLKVVEELIETIENSIIENNFEKIGNILDKIEDLIKDIPLLLEKFERFKRGIKILGNIFKENEK